MERTKNKSNSDVKLLKTLLIKDLKLEIRQINDIFSIFLFGIISTFIFSQAYTLSTQNSSMSLDIFVIQVWVILFFIINFVMLKSFVNEKESGTLDGLLSSQVNLSIIILSKIIFGFILLSVIELVLFLFSIVISSPNILLNGADSIFLYVFFGIVLPTIDLSICGTIASAFSMYAKKKSFILPILLFPIILPIISPIISINLGFLQGNLLSSMLIEILFIIMHIILMFSIFILVSGNLLQE